MHCIAQWYSSREVDKVCPDYEQGSAVVAVAQRRCSWAYSLPLRFSSATCIKRYLKGFFSIFSKTWEAFVWSSSRKQVLWIDIADHFLSLHVRAADTTKLSRRKTLAGSCPLYWRLQSFTWKNYITEKRAWQITEVSDHCSPYCCLFTVL